jgi:hypothetical protein
LQMLHFRDMNLIASSLLLFALTTFRKGTQTWDWRRAI